jgi:GntR family transcriptional regulator
MFSDIQIDKATPIPIYYQLKQILLKLIHEKKLVPGDNIPTEIELSAMFDISRTPIRQAIMELVIEGHLVRKKGRGTFVSNPKIEQRYFQTIIQSFKEMISSEHMPRTEVLELRKMVPIPEDKVYEVFQLQPNEQVTFLKRLRYADNEPLLVDEVYISPLCPDFIELGKERIGEEGLYYFLRKDKMTRIMHAIRQVEAITASKSLSRLLQVATGFPIQMITTTGYNEAEQPVEYTTAFFRGDRNKFRVELYDK